MGGKLTNESLVTWTIHGRILTDIEGHGHQYNQAKPIIEGDRKIDNGYEDVHYSRTDAEQQVAAGRER